MLADITATPYWLADCQTAAEAATAYWECGTNEPAAYAQLVGAIAAHAKGYIDDYEVINEPDGSWAWTGTPEQYAWMLSDVYQAVHEVDPGASVMFGGLMANDGWIQQVFATHGANAARSFDIANVHIRDLQSRLAPNLESSRALFGPIRLPRPHMSDRARLPVRPGIPIRPVLPGDHPAERPGAAGGLPASVRAGAGQGGSGASVRHRTRQPDREVRVRGRPVWPGV